MYREIAKEYDAKISIYIDITHLLIDMGFLYRQATLHINVNGVK